MFVPFGCAAPVDAGSRATMLAMAIGEALACAAGGLFVALAALVAMAGTRRCAERRDSALRAQAQAVANLVLCYRRRLSIGEARPHVGPPGYRQPRR